MKKIILIIMLLLVTGCSTKEITKDIIKKDKVLGDLVFKEPSIKYENGISTFETIIVNNSDKDMEVQEVNIALTDNEGNVLATLVGFVGDSIASKSSVLLTSYSDIDLTNYYDMTYEVR